MTRKAPDRRGNTATPTEDGAPRESPSPSSSKYMCCTPGCEEDVTSKVNAALEDPGGVVMLLRATPNVGKEVERASTVMVQCSKSHWSVYTSDGRGWIASQADTSGYQSMLELVAPKATWERLDAFGKWLFQSTAVVGTLGAAFGVTSLATLQGGGRALLLVATALLGVSLALAGSALAPVPRKPDKKHKDTVAIVKSVLWRRSWALRISAVLFGSALIGASLAPWLSRPPRLPHEPRVGLAYSIAKDSLVADIGGRGLAPGAMVAAEVRFADADTALVVQGLQVASDSGKLSLRLAAKVPEISLVATIRVTCPGPSKACEESSVEVPLRRAAPTGKTPVTGGRSTPIRR